MAKTEENKSLESAGDCGDEGNKLTIIERGKAMFWRGVSRVKQFVDDNPWLIPSLGTAFTIALVTKEEHDKGVLMQENRKKDLIIDAQRETIGELRERRRRDEVLMDEKDRRHLEVVSDGLRHGSPKAAEDMAEWKRQKRAQQDS